MTLNIPPDNREPGDTGHIADHNAISDALTALSEASGRGGTIGPSNGTDDTSAIQALLTAARTAGGGVVKGTPGQTYLVSATLLAGSGTTLDMTGCNVTQLNSAQAAPFNLISNYAAFNPNRTVTDGAITTSQNTLTSATASFTSADVGRTVTVAGAGPGSQVLTGNIATVVSGTQVTLADLQQNALNAWTTVSAATVSIYTRDTNVTVTGGIWNAGSNNGNADTYARHCFRFRHVDGLTVIGEQGGKILQTQGKYLINPGDCTRVIVRGWEFSGSSDGVHINGPASIIHVSDITGTSGDDFCAVTTLDYGQYADVGGPVHDLIFEDINPSYTPTTSLNLLAGDGSGATPATPEGYGITKVRLAGFGGYGENGGTTISVNTSANGGAVNDIVIDGVHADRGGSPGYSVIIGALIQDSIQVSNVVADSSAGVEVLAGSIVNRLSVSGAITQSTTIQNNMVIIGGTVTDLSIDGFNATLANGAYMLTMSSSSAVITQARIVRGSITGDGSGGLLDVESNKGTLGLVHLTDIDVSNVAWALGAYGITTTALVSNISASSCYGLFYLDSTANLTVLGGNGVESTLGITTTTGCALRVNAPGITVNLSGITTAAVGDLVTDTSGNLQLCTSATGPTWRNLSAATGGTLTGYLAPKVVTLTDGSSVTIDATQGNVFNWPLGGSSHTLAAPSNPVNGESFRLRIAYSGAYTPLFAAAYDFGSDGQPTWTAASGQVDQVAFEYDANLSKWCCLGWKLGYS